MALTTLRRARLERGLTQLDVSLKAGIAPSRLSILERAIVQPTEDELTRLTAVLGLEDQAVSKSDAADVREAS